MKNSGSKKLYKASLIVGAGVTFLAYFLIRAIVKWSAGGDPQVYAMATHQMGGIFWIYAISLGIASAIGTWVVIMILNAIKKRA